MPVKTIRPTAPFPTVCVDSLRDPAVSQDIDPEPHQAGQLPKRTTRVPSGVRPGACAVLSLPNRLLDTFDPQSGECGSGEPGDSPPRRFEGL